jgi:hypothetical protein
MKATRSQSIVILANTKIAGHTVVFQNDGKIMRIDHLVDRRPEVEKPQDSKGLIYRAALRSIKGSSDDADI